MSKGPSCFLIAFSIVVLFFSGCRAPEEKIPVFAETPDGARFSTSDIDAFWVAYDAAFASDSPDERVQAFQNEYVNAGSDELRWMFANKFCLHVPLSYFVERVASAKGYYDSVRAVSESVKTAEMRERIMASLRRFDELYPEAVFPDMYFMMGDLSNGGTFSGSAVDLAIEAYLADENTPLSGVDESFIPYIQGTDHIPGLVMHEVVHVQQRYLSADRDTLLAHSIIEGGANFIEELVCGISDNEALQSYGDAHEAELWEDFREVMNGYDFSGWLYYESPLRPTNSGYYVGYKICQAYYERATDKHQAILDMMNLENGGEFLALSGYEGRM